MLEACLVVVYICEEYSRMYCVYASSISAELGSVISGSGFVSCPFHNDISLCLCAVPD